MWKIGRHWAPVCFFLSFSSLFLKWRKKARKKNDHKPNVFTSPHAIETWETAYTLHSNIAYSYTINMSRQNSCSFGTHQTDQITTKTAFRKSRVRKFSRISHNKLSSRLHPYSIRYVIEPYRIELDLKWFFCVCRKKK